MMSKIMQRLERLAKESEEDDIIDYGTAKHKYGSSLADMIVLEWQDLESPWQWVSSDPQLREEFERIFANNSKQTNDIELFRGTDHYEYLKLKKGDILDYSDRYTSWSTDRKVSIRFADDERPILLVYKGPAISFDLCRTNPHEKEHILPPMNFVVSNTINISKYEEDPDARERTISAALNGFDTHGGEGKIIFLEALAFPIDN